MKLKRHMPLAVMVLLLSLCLIGSVSTGLAAVFAAPAVDEVHSITSEEDGITQNQLDAMAIDKQSWKLQEHMTWADYKANPVVDWEDATDHSIAPSRPLRGALILCDFPDVPMISGDALSSELMGNPQHRADREDLAEFWVDFLNTPGKMNNFMTFNGYILENSYGDWAVEMDAFGPYQLSGFEFQYGFWSSGNTAFDDYTFSRQFPRTPSGSGANTEAFRLALEDGVEFFDPETGEMIYNFVFVLHAGYDQSGSWQELGEMMFLGRDKIAAVPKGELKHPLTGKLLPDISGMDFTGWARIKKIQEIVEDPDFNLRAEWPNFYMLDIERTWRNQTATGAVYTAALGAHEAGGKLEAAFDQFKIDYPFTDRTQTQFRDTVYRPEFAQDYANRQKLIDPDDPDSEFTEEWLAFAADNTDERILAKLKDLLEGAEESARTSTTNPYYQAVPTRYIPWSTWYGGVGIWSGAGSAIDTNVYLSIPLSIQGESDGMATFAHESGHLFGLPDNYNGPYDIPRTRSYTGPWDLMSRGSFGGPYGNHTRWDIPSVNGSSVPSNQVLRGKYVNGYSDLENDILYLNYAEIKDGLVITEIFGRNVPTNLGIKDKEGKEITGYRGLMIQGMLDQTPEETWAQISLPGSGTLRIDPFKWNWGPNGPGSNNAPGETRRFNGFSLEVMDKTGYDSFLPDHGVMIAKIANITANRAGPISTYIQDSHPDPLNLVDFTAADGTINMLSDGDQLQLASSLFHAGVHNDPNYYRDHSEKWLATDERTGVHGNVVNEYIDPYNKLHFYILDKIENPGKYGEFLSYQIAVRSTADDAAQVGGELTLAKGDFSEASEGNYAVQKFILEQSADANGTDIVRIKIEIDETKPAGALLEEDVVILNNLYTIEPGGEIRFDVYIKATDGVLESFPEGLEVKASSETALPTLGDVNLITDKEIEITYSEPVKSNEEAHEIFSVLVDGEEVEWEFLSYFNFGEYADRGGVVNLRLTEPLDVGEPRGRRRETAAETFLARTEHIKGPIAAEKVTVSLGGGTAKTAEWEPFYMERSLGNMSRLWVWGSAKAGNNGTQLLLANPNNYTSNNIFSATTDPLFTDEYIVRQVAEGINRFVGRSEYMNLPIIDSGFKALIVGPSQSVYEVPEYRELYVHGVTTDTFTRPSIKATEVPGNFDPDTGEYKKPYIVGTSDDVMRYDSPLKADDGVSPARPKSDHFHLGEAFFDIYWEMGMVQGCPRFPLSYYNAWDDYRYELHIEDAYNKAKAAGLWPETAMMNSVKDYYVYGAMSFWEMITESEAFEEMSWPVNTRAEIYEYDYPLYWALSGAHGKYEYWTGVGAGQNLTSRSDFNKYNTPWFWWNQPDNFGLPADADPTVGVAYPPLAIESVTIISNELVEVKFNREVNTIAAVTDAANWRVYIGGRQLTGITDYHGYGWKSIRLRTTNRVNYTTGLSTSNAADRLDNGKPYGRYFAGFTQKDIDQRKVSAGGWIANDQLPGANALDFGQFVGLDDAIAMGAGPTEAGTVYVEYVGGATTAPQVLDWDGNELEKGKRVAADFRPWEGHVYRSPLTGFYVYLDSNVGSKDFYMYRNEPEGFVQPTAKDIAMSAAHQYEAQFTNNKTVTYPANAGGADFDFAFNGSSGSLTDSVNTTHYTWNNGVVSLGGQNLTNGPVEYDRVGQRIADGAIRNNGGMFLAAGSVLGNHPGRQTIRTSLATGIADGLRVEGWGGNVFQSEDIAIVRDYNLCRYKNENLVIHEGGHGINSFLGGEGNYGQNVYNDISAAFATATAPKNGTRWFSVDNVRSYTGSRGEYITMGTECYTGTSRESFEGINDGTWTPVSTREELFRYDPYAGEVYKRLYFTGDLGLWYEGKVGDPQYRVILEDWELLRDQNEEFSHWTSENDLLAWGFSIFPTAYDNPHTGTHNPLIRWVSWNSPSVWNPEPYLEPNASFPNNRFDFVGRNAYHPEPDGKSPIKVQTHPFLVEGGIKKPARPADIEALVTPVSGTIDNTSIAMPQPVLIEFKFADFNGEITTNNAQTSFEVTLDGKPSHFYFRSFEVDEETGIATVTLRLEWPVEEDVDVTVSQPVVIEVADVWTVPGGMVDVTYSIKGNALGFTAFDLELPFNEHFVATKVTPAAKVAAAGMFFVSNITGDTVKVAFASSENISGDGLLFTVTYQVPASVLAIFDEALDINVKALKTETNKDEIIDLGYSVRPGTLVIGLLGDVDGNGTITPEDAMLILQMYVGLIPWTPRALLLGDINGDGVVDTTDAALILRMVVGG